MIQRNEQHGMSLCELITFELKIQWLHIDRLIPDHNNWENVPTSLLFLAFRNRILALYGVLLLAVEDWRSYQGSTVCKNLRRIAIRTKVELYDWSTLITRIDGQKLLREFSRSSVPLESWVNRAGFRRKQTEVPHWNNVALSCAWCMRGRCHC